LEKNASRYKEIRNPTLGMEKKDYFAGIRYQRAKEGSVALRKRGKAQGRGEAKNCNESITRWKSRGL